jgi:methylglutaconyl-CoA hydratase
VSELSVSIDGPVATVTLERPDKRNALGPDQLRQLGDTFGELGNDASVRVIVLAGAGSAFSAGADLEWMRASADMPPELNGAGTLAMQAAFEAVDTCPKGVVARVHGPAIGGGAGLVACADVAIAVEGARFAFAESRLGLVPAVVSPYVLRKIGAGHARALFTTGRMFGAAEAYRIGLVHRVVSAGELDAAVSDAVGDLLNAGPDAIAACKRLVRDATMSLALPDLPERIAAARASSEGMQGVAAFLAKEEPPWRRSDGS